MSDPEPSACGGWPPSSTPLDFRASASLTVLRRRHQLLQQLRRFFDDRGFLEVTTPLVASETIVDRFIEPFRLTAFSDPRRPDHGPTYFLQTSPELHMKRLLASGATAIYQVTQAFRATELGPWHNPEFTIVEWYRVADDMAAGIKLLGDLVVDLLRCPPPLQRSYREVFQEYACLDPLTTEDDQLRRALHPVLDASGYDRDDLLNLAFSTLVQPRLCGPHPTVVYGFPASQAALAKRNPDDPRVAQRFELFHGGVELANGYDELTDAEELQTRQRLAMEARIKSGARGLPIPARFLAAAAEGIPACTGVALGLDRLVMLATGQECLAQAVPFPWPLA